MVEVSTWDKGGWSIEQTFMLLHHSSSFPMEKDYFVLFISFHISENIFCGKYGECCQSRGEDVRCRGVAEVPLAPAAGGLLDTFIFIFLFFLAGNQLYEL
jgi:hypothetical protein